MKKKHIFWAMGVAALALAACNTVESSSSKSTSKTDTEESSTSTSTSTGTPDVTDTSTDPDGGEDTDTSSVTDPDEGHGSDTSSATEPDGGEDTDSSTDPDGGEDTDTTPSTDPDGGEDSSSDEPDVPVVAGEITFEGVSNKTIKVGQYFDVFEGVSAKDSNDADFTNRVRAIGNVNYGVAGSYQIKYEVQVGEDKYSTTRTITVENGTIPGQVARNRAYGELTNNEVGSGSYLSGGASAPTVSYKNPSNGQAQNNAIVRPGDTPFLGNAAFNEGPIPTNTWYSGFFYANHGGLTTAATNPLAIKSSSAGISVSDYGDGFLEVYKVNDTTGTSMTTASNHSTGFQDITVKGSAVTSSVESRIISYTEDSAKLALVNPSTNEVAQVVTMAQGSPMAFFEFSTSKATVTLRDGGVAEPMKFYDLQGNEINNRSTYTGSAIIVTYPKTHYGYGSNYPNAGLGAPLYREQSFLLSAPEGSTFTLSQGNTANAALTLSIEIDLNGKNYLTVSSLSSKKDAAFYQESAYSVLDSYYYSYEVDHESSNVHTTMGYRVHVLEEEKGYHPLLGLLPHQWKNSDDYGASEVQMTTMRGQLKLFKTDSFTYDLSFAGLLPSFAKPTGGDYDDATMRGYLEDLLERNQPGEDGFSESKKNFIDAPGPYWNAKALYPLSQGLVIADQIGADDLKQEFVSLLKDDLTDWYTYDGTSDDRYLYYDEVAGSLIWSNDDFSTASRLSDHHFTAGYLVYASAILAAYDEGFKSDYLGMAELQMKEYMNADESDSMFPTFRTFDPYAGHSWADGKADTGDGNNQESSGEALNSWVAAYLLSLVSEDRQSEDAAIWGFVNELEAVKQYWFNYDGDNWNEDLAKSVHAVGIVWGTKNDHSTWFGSNPEFIYGIHWMPTGEYVSSYALDDGELAVLQDIYEEMESHVGGAPRTWQSNMWAVKAIYDPEGALEDFDASTILADDYPSELSGSYWMVEALASFGHKDGAAYVEGEFASGSVYVKDGVKTAIVYNPGQAKTVKVHVDGQVKEIAVAANSLASYPLQ